MPKMSRVEPCYDYILGHKHIRSPTHLSTDIDSAFIVLRVVLEEAFIELLWYTYSLASSNILIDQIIWK